MMNTELWQKRIRNYAGLLGGLLPWISLFGAWMYGLFTGIPTDRFWRELSISATYYTNPALAGILTSASLVLMCYDGYDLQDNIITTLSGVFGIMIVLFPCSCSIAPEHTGLFQLPVGISDTVHSVVAIIFFLLLSYNTLFLFTKTDISKEKTKEKIIRNIIYRICGIGMVCSLCLMFIPIKFNAKTWWLEMFALMFFAISWLVKGGAFPFLNDK